MHSLFIKNDKNLMSPTSYLISLSRFFNFQSVLKSVFLALILDKMIRKKRHNYEGIWNKQEGRKKP